jgi:hypothetical protein
VKSVGVQILVLGVKLWKYVKQTNENAPVGGAINMAPFPASPTIASLYFHTTQI